jgi:hypothetical protein
VKAAKLPPCSREGRYVLSSVAETLNRRLNMYHSGSLDLRMDGIIVTDTTTQRPASLLSDKKSESSGLFGRPLNHRPTECIANLYQWTDGTDVAFQLLASGAFLRRTMFTKRFVPVPVSCRFIRAWSINKGLVD